MKTLVKMLVAAVLAGGMVWGAGAQTNEVNFNASAIRLNGATSVCQYYLRLRPIVPLPGACAGSIAELSASNIVFEASLVRVLANMLLTGNLNGVPPKNFIHPHPTDASKIIRYAAIESAEALTVVRGVARTENGEAVIELPEHFSMVTNKDEPITVNITPEGAPVLLYVKYKSTDRVVVAMREPDFIEFKDVEFSYQVTGVRDGFEKMETVIGIEELDKTTMAREDVQKRIEGLYERMREIFGGAEEE